MARTEPTNESLLTGIQQGQNLGVTEMASSEPGKEDEVLVAGLLDRLVQIPGVKKKVQSVLTDAEPENTLINVKKKKKETTADDLKVDIKEAADGKIEPTLDDGFDVDIQVKQPKIDETKFELDTDAIDINFDKIETPEDFQNVIKQYTDNLPTPKVQTQKQTELLASELNVKEEILAGAGFKNAEEVYAARTFIKQSGEYLLKLADDVINDKTGNELLKLKFKKQLTTHGLFVQQFMKGRANVGRALSAFKIPTMKNPADQDEILSLMITQQGGSTNIRKIAEQVKNDFALNGMPGTNKLVGDNWWKRGSKAWSEAYRGGLLFSPKTLLRNVIGNAVFLAYTIPEYTIAGIYGTAENVARGGFNLVRGKHWGDGAGGMSWEQGAARMYGLINGFKDAFRVANKAYRTGQPSDSMSKYEGANSEYFTAKNLSGSKINLENTTLGSVIDFMGKMYRLPYAGLQYGDEFFKEIARSMELHTTIMERATKLAANQDIPFKEAMEKTIMDIASKPDEFKNSLDEAARYYAFQDKLPLAIERYTTAFQNTPLIGTIMLPFSKTPVNVTRRAIDLTGLGILPKKFLTNQNYRTRQMAKLTMAGYAYATISDFYAQGRITGGYPLLSNGRFDMKMKNALDALEWKPYSLVFAADDHPDDLPLFDENGLPTGDHIYVSYNGLEPVGAILGVTAHSLELMRRSNDPGVRDNAAMALSLATMEYFDNMPMIEGMSDLITSLTNRKLDDYAKDALVSIISAPTIPMAPSTGTGYLISGEFDEDGKFNILKRNQDEDFERDMVTHNEDGTFNMNYGQPKKNIFLNPLINTYNEMLYKLPYDEAVGSVGHYIFGIDKQGQKLPPEYDIFGNAIVRSSEMGLMVDIVNTYFSPVGFKKVSAKPLHYHENERLGGIITNPSNEIQGIKLRPIEYADWIVFSKKEPHSKYNDKIIQMNFEEYISRYMNTNEYKFEMNDNEKIKKIQKINSDFIELGKAKLLRKYPNLAADIDAVGLAIDKGIPLNNNILEAFPNDSQ